MLLQNESLSPSLTQSLVFLAGVSITENIPEVILKRPIKIPRQLACYIEENGAFFNQGEYLTNTAKRFLSTVGILTCVAVFAWTKKGNLRGRNSGLGVALNFGAHIDNECYLSGKPYLTGKSAGLQYMLGLMRETFKFTDPQDVICYVIGGHSKGCPGPFQKMNMDILMAIHSTGFTINSTFFNFFEGNKTTFCSAEVLGKFFLKKKFNFCL